MSRAGGEPTEQPTPRRRAQARRRGQIALSHDLGGAAALLAIFALLAAQAPGAVARLTAYLAAALARAPAGGAADQAARAGLDATLSLLAPPLGLAVLVTLLVGLAQTGGLVTFHPVRVDFARLSPAAALRGAFDRWTLYQLGKGAAGAGIVAIVAWLTARPLLPQLAGLSRMPARRALEAFGAVGARLGLRIALALAALAALDVVIVRARHRRALLMTREEARRERAEIDGDDVHRQRRRRAHRELGVTANLADVARAVVVITDAGAGRDGDDGALAVALAYHRGGARAPVVLRKGRRHASARIQRIAREAGVAIVGDAALAAALQPVADGDEIPEAHFEAVAEVLKAVYAKNTG